MRIITIVFFVLAAVLTGYFTVTHYPAEVQKKIKENVLINLKNSDINWAEVSIDGRNVTLSGNAPDKEDKIRAYEVADSTWGVNKTTNLIKAPEDVISDEQIISEAAHSIADKNLNSASKNLNEIKSKIEKIKNENIELIKQDNKKTIIETEPTSNEINIKFSNQNGKINLVSTTASTFIKETLSGISNNIKFEPEQKIDRAELKKILYSLSGLVSKYPESAFSLNGKNIFINKLKEKDKESFIKEITDIIGKNYVLNFTDNLVVSNHDSASKIDCEKDLNDIIKFSKGQIGIHIPENYVAMKKFYLVANACSEKQFEIEGCADASETNPPKNQGLARSVSVANYFIYAGINKSRINVYSSCSSKAGTASIKTVNKGK